MELFERYDINEYLIDLDASKQVPYKPNYSLKLVELEILKTYMKTNLANGFIWHFKSLLRALILFVWKLDSSYRLCVNY